MAHRCFEQLKIIFKDSDSSDVASSNNMVLYNSTSGSDITNDTMIAELFQQNLYDEDAMDVDNESNPEQLDTDAAYALQLQEEEYSKETNAELRARRRQRTNKTTTNSNAILSSNRTLSDAELAAKLQQEEDRKQRNIRINTRNTTNHILVNALRHQVFNSEILNIPVNDEDDNGNSYEALLQLDTSVQKKHLSSQQINILPTEQFKPKDKAAREDLKCNVCLSDFELNETLRRLPCLHVFHKDCIDRWIKQENLCPICRSEVMKN